jgi:uncharacterized protein
MKIQFIALLAFIVLLAPSAWAQSNKTTTSTATKTTASPHRIVWDMAAGDTAMHAGIMRQLNNVKRGWPDAQIEVVVHGKALDMLVTDKSTKPSAIKDLQARGVTFVACENTMRMRKVTKEQLLPGVNTVPMAIGELVLKQEEGWSYIKL